MEHLKLQAKAKTIFAIAKDLIIAGMTELEAQQKVEVFLQEHPDVERLWHQVVVKFDAATSIPGVAYRPSKRVLTRIVTLDLGFVIAGMEVDYAETWLIEPNPKLQQMIDASQKVWQQAADIAMQVSPAELFFHIKKLVEQAGYAFVAKSAGHRLGKFPTSKTSYKIKAEELAAALPPGPEMLEIHLSNGNYGAFFEDMVII